MDLVDPDLGCTWTPEDQGIEIFHNLGATVSWDTNPDAALVSSQTIWLTGNEENIWVMEMAFANVTGSTNGPDLVVLGQDPDLGEGYLLIYRNLGNGQFASTPYVRTTTDVTLRGLITADLDGDGDIDIAAAGSDIDCVHTERDFFVVFENITSDPVDPQFIDRPYALNISNDTAPGDIVAADFYALSPGQSFGDLVTPNPGNASYTKIRNLGSLQFDPTTVDRPSECDPEWDFVTATADRFGADQLWDFAAVDPDDLFAGVFKGNGLGGFESYCDDPALGYPLFQPALEWELVAHGIDSGNLNGGPYPDLVVVILDLVIAVDGPDWPSAVAVLLGKADGTFQTPSPTEAYIFRTDDPNGSDWVLASAMVELVDLNADGFDDIVVTNHRSYNFSVLINKMRVTTTPG